LPTFLLEKYSVRKKNSTKDGENIENSDEGRFGKEGEEVFE